MIAQESKTWLGYPEPEDTASIKRISAEEVAEMIKKEGSSERNFQLVDVRRSDLTVGECITSLAIPLIQLMGWIFVPSFRLVPVPNSRKRTNRAT